MGAIRGRPPLFVTIIPSGGAVGKTEFPKDWPPEFLNHFDDAPQKRAYIETRISTGLPEQSLMTSGFPLAFMMQATRTMRVRNHRGQFRLGGQ
jgi:hypothetical protein